MSLTDKEKESLNKAVYEYLTLNGYDKSAEAFLAECPHQVSKGQGQPGSENLLEKKWITIMKLNKRIMELEVENSGLKDELKTVSKMKKTTANMVEIENLFPKAPAAHTFTGHKGMVNKVAIHPLYSQLASIGEDESIRLWDFEAKKYEGSLKGHTERINDIDFDPSGTYLASASADLLIKVWDIDQKTCIKTFTGHDHSISCVRWKSTSDFILSASRDETIKLWELNTGFCVRTYRGHEKWVRMAVFNHNCSRIASCSDDNTLMLWDYNKEQSHMTLYGHSHVVDCIIFVNGLEGKKTINESKYNSEGKAAVEQNMTEIEKSKKKLQEAGKEEDVTPLEFIISGSRDKTIKIWSAQTGNILLNIEGHSGWVRGLAMHHSNKYFYSCSEDKSIKVWNLSSGKMHSKIDGAHGHFITDIVSHPVYLVCATSSVDSTVKVWECR
jgi:platelet-activating factor acetylhydrolase IB subunit alpha